MITPTDYPRYYTSWAADQNARSAVARRHRFVMDTGSLMAHEMHTVLMNDPLLRCIYEWGRTIGEQGSAP